MVAISTHQLTQGAISAEGQENEIKFITFGKEKIKLIMWGWYACLWRKSKRIYVQIIRINK